MLYFLKMVTQSASTSLIICLRSLFLGKDVSEFKDFLKSFKKSLEDRSCSDKDVSVEDRNKVSNIVQKYIGAEVGTDIVSKAQYIDNFFKEVEPYFEK